MIEAVIFDLDGVLLDTEQVWDAVREELTQERGGRWHDGAQADMMGMSSPEWSRYMHERLELADSPEEISAEVVRRMLTRYRKRLPLVHGARDALERVASRWPLGLASSSNRELIDEALAQGAMSGFFRVTVSSEEVERGKPAPDVYLAAARRLGVDPASAAAVEDSRSGILAAAEAGLRVIAIPNRLFPPDREALAEAAVVLESIAALTPDVIERS